MKKICLSQIEEKVLKLSAQRKFNPLTATEEEQDAEISLIEKASQYEIDNNLVDERIDFTPDCNLLVWFYQKFKEM